MNIDTKHHLQRNVVTIEKMLKGLDTQIKFNNEATAELSKAFNHLRIAADNMKEAVVSLSVGPVE